jgi:anti-sigma factor RsiW
VLTCYRYRRRIGAWLDGALDTPGDRAVAAHVEACPHCAGEVATLSRMKSVLASMAKPADPDWTGFWPGVVRGIQDGKVVRPAPRRAGWLRPRWAYGGAIAAALLVTLGVWQFAPTTVPPELPVIVQSVGTDDPDASVVVYSTAERDLTVVWVSGLAGQDDGRR